MLQEIHLVSDIGGVSSRIANISSSLPAALNYSWGQRPSVPGLHLFAQFDVGMDRNWLGNCPYLGSNACQIVRIKIRFQALMKTSSMRGRQRVSGPVTGNYRSPRYNGICKCFH